MPNYEIIDQTICVFPQVVKQKKKPNKFGAYGHTISQMYVGLVSKEGLDSLKKLKDTIIEQDQDISKVFAPYVKKIFPEYHNNLSIDMYGFIFVGIAQSLAKPYKLGSPTIVTTGKNLGRKNQTNAFTQALNESEKKYERQVLDTVYYAPMLADGGSILNEPEIVEETLTALFKPGQHYETKFDGLRMLCIYDGKDLKFYTRNMKDAIPPNRVKTAMLNVVKQVNRGDNRVVFDGELYRHGLSLSEISGLVRKFDEDGKEALSYFIFDMFFLDKNNQPTKLNLTHRRQLLDKINIPMDETLNDPKYNSIQVTESYHPKSASELIDLYNERLNSGYEGLMLKYDVPYNNNSRDYMLKLKPHFREEFRIVGYGQGKGKDAGLIKFKCELTTETIKRALEYKQKKNPGFHIKIEKVIKSPYTFNVRPADTNENRKCMFDLMNTYVDGEKYFAKNVLNKLYIVQFQDYSDTLVPLRPVGIGMFE